MSFNDAELLGEFVEESLEHLSGIENQLLQVEAGGENVDIDLINELFRYIHSIKGAAGFLGLMTIEKLSHRMENILDQMRNKELTPNSHIADVLLRSSDKLQELLGNVAHSNDADVDEHITALDRILANSSGSSELASSKSESKAETPSIEANNHILSNDNQSQIDTEDPQIMQEKNNIQNSESLSQDGNQFEEGVTSMENITRTTSQLETNVRVSVGVLDNLMNLAGELVLSRNQLMRSIATADQDGLEGVSARLDQVTSELQEAIMLTRMQPVGNVFNRLPRLVRDLSQKLSKKCKLILSGEDVELDKTIIEAIADPLTHLARNSIDHGVEIPEVRESNGKNPTGTVHLKAFHQAGKVKIVIQDDGGGIDGNKLKEKAISKRLITREQAEDMPDREAVRLIFHPGFSTAEIVTDVSGRGVGMDVVRTNIEKLGGSIEVDSTLGVGTTISLTLPLTLAIIPSLIVRSGENRFAIPQVSIAELVRIRPSEVSSRIGHVKNAEVLKLRGDLLPLVRLDQAMGLNDSEVKQVESDDESQKALNIIVVESGQLRYGVIVDGLHDSEEIVVKPLGRHLVDCTTFAGATVLGDGRVALILDVSGISSHMNLQMPAEEIAVHDDELQAESHKESQSMLLYSNDPSEYFAVPVGLIARIERIRSDQIDIVGGQELLQYQNTSMALFSLEKISNATPRQEQSRLNVVVFNVANREVGLIVPKILDIREVSMDIDVVTLREPGIMGSVVIDEKTVRLVDLFELTNLSRPDWKNYENEADSDSNEPSTILLAEDSTFFRNHVCTTLEEFGYRVIACEDGSVAWNQLRTSPESVHLVVTDIEMPNMDGYQLCRNIKDDPALRQLPVIALTSLAGEEDIRRGQESGIDDYQIKMDRENLLASIKKLITLDKSENYSLETVGS